MAVTDTRGQPAASDLDMHSADAPPFACGFVRTPATTRAGWSDAELLARMLERERGAWNEFVRRFEPLIMTCLRKVLQRFVAILSSSDVDDVYAMLMSRLCRNEMVQLRAYQEGRGVRLSTWIGLLARNAAYDFLRIRAQEQRAMQSASTEAQHASPEDPETVLESRRMRLALAEQVKGLSERDQTFVRLCYLERREPEEIAREMSISLSTVYSKKHKVHSRLQTALQARR